MALGVAFRKCLSLFRERGVTKKNKWGGEHFGRGNLKCLVTIAIKIFDGCFFSISGNVRWNWAWSLENLSSY